MVTVSRYCTQAISKVSADSTVEPIPLHLVSPEHERPKRTERESHMKMAIPKVPFTLWRLIGLLTPVSLKEGVCAYPVTSVCMSNG